jgi:hypothetical protein
MAYIFVIIVEVFTSYYRKSINQIEIFSYSILAETTTMTSLIIERFNQGKKIFTTGKIIETNSGYDFNQTIFQPYAGHFKIQYPNTI